MTNWKPGASIITLKKRAELLHRVREFFAKREVLEVETPSISQFPTIDLHLESFSVKIDQPDRSLSYLITSPEYHMKRLLCAGIGSIYQICKAFRREEIGEKHNSEFTIIEWYRVGWDHWKLMEEIEDLLDTMLHTGKADRLSYREMFLKFLKVPPHNVTMNVFLNLCTERNLTPPESLKNGSVSIDERLEFLMGMVIEPQLGLTKPVFIYDYPASQANLAKLYEDNPELSMRFELYYKGLELANGFCELTDAEKQENRFIKENKTRKKAGKTILPIDQLFLDAMRAGMPNCAGVALGFERIVMLALGINDIDKVMAFSWKRS